MNERIVPGDLVMIVRNHCGTAYCGEIHTVRRIDTTQSPNDISRCGSCGKNTGHSAVAVLWDDGGGIPLPWLKKIPPLTEPTESTMKEVA